MKNLVTVLVLGLAATPTLAADPEMTIIQDQCVSCHNLDGPAAQTVSELRSRKGPDLFYAGNKYRADWMVAWLQKPERIRPAGMFYLDHIKPGTKWDQIDKASLKPHVTLNKNEAQTVTKTLMKLKAKSSLLMTEEYISGPSPMGEMSFDKFYGCMACHEIEPGYGGQSGPEVYTAGRRLTPEFMMSFITDPQAWNPKGLMPNKHVPAANIPKLVNFMLDLAKEDWK